MSNRYNLTNILEAFPPLHPTESWPGEWEWLGQKWAMNNIILPLYKMTTFGKENQINMIKLPITDIKGFCIIDVEIAKGLGDTYEDTVKVKVKAMIDTGAQVSAVSTKLFAQMDLDKTGPAQVTGFKEQNTNSVFFFLMVSGINNEHPLPIQGIVDTHMNSDRFDVVIGADFLRHIKFERNGPAGIFILSIEQ